MTITSIRNKTPSHLTLVGAGGEEVAFAPLQEVSIEDASAFDLNKAEHQGLVRLGREAPQELGERIAIIVFGGGFWLAVIAWFIGWYFDPPGGLTEGEWSLSVWIVAGVILAGIVLVMVIQTTNSLSFISRVTMQVVALLVILTIGLGLPAGTIYFFGEGQALLTEQDAKPLALFGRLIQLAFIAIASLLPVLLFFLFDRFQLATLRRRLYAALFRLDPTMSTEGEIDAKYGSQIAEVYGTESEGRGRLAPGSRWPVLVCAVVITIGWIVALAPVGEAPSKPEEIMNILMPQPTAFVFGFLGAYFFSLRLIAIRYARGDLKPKAYSHIMTRILIVAILSWVLDVIFGGQSIVMLVLAFLFGITPDEFFTWLKEMIRTKTSLALKESLPESIVPTPTTLPLTDIEGIDLYDRGRLESEGIVNIEGLAHHELIDLIIETRIPVPRLIDWIDQAILYLHLAGGSERGGLAKLRNYGIRTASDLLKAWQAADDRKGKELVSFKQLLGGDQPPYRLEVIRDSLLDDEWIEVVQAWRLNEQPMPIRFDALPSSVEALERWADKQLELERYAGALNALERALTIRDTASTRLRIARILASSPVVALRDREEARQNAHRAYELDSQNHASLVELMEIFLVVEDYASAKKMCDDAIAIIERRLKGKLKEQEMGKLKAAKKRIEDRLAESSS